VTPFIFITFGSPVFNFGHNWKNFKAKVLFSQNFNYVENFYFFKIWDAFNYILVLRDVPFGKLIDFEVFGWVGVYCPRVPFSAPSSF
jgi:hypothetical protein